MEFTVKTDNKWKPVRTAESMTRSYQCDLGYSDRSLEVKDWAHYGGHWHQLGLLEFHWSHGGGWTGATGSLVFWEKDYKPEFEVFQKSPCGQFYKAGTVRAVN
jgi:hypothetical protein